MATVMETSERGVRPELGELTRHTPDYQAYAALYLGYTALPLVAGLDKFFHVLVNWDKYLSPFAAAALGAGTAAAFMKLVGVVEIAAGLLVAARPRWGSAVVGLWLCGIVLNLLAGTGYYDIALRDFGLAVGAFALWRMSAQHAA